MARLRLVRNIAFAGLLLGMLTHSTSTAIAGGFFSPCSDVWWEQGPEVVVIWDCDYSCFEAQNDCDWYCWSNDFDLGSLQSCPWDEEPIEHATCYCDNN